MKPILVALDNKIGSVFASEKEINSDFAVCCNGRTIRRREWPCLFTVRNISGDYYTLPNYERLLPGKVHFYMIVNSDGHISL